MSRELLQQALEALETHVPHVYKDRGYPPIEALRAALAQPEPIDQWKAAIDDELICCHIGTVDSFPGAKAALKNLIDWHMSVALDPTVSSDAQALIERGKSAAPVVREPLTDAQIDKIFDDAHENMPKGELFRTFVTRAIERAHGIGGGGK